MVARKPLVNVSGAVTELAATDTIDASNIALTPTAVKTANYTAAAGDLVPVDISSGNVTVTLPTAPADKTRVGIKLIGWATGNFFTYACAGSDVLNKAGGLTTGALSGIGQAVTLQYKSSSSIWYAQVDDGQLAAEQAMRAFNDSVLALTTQHLGVVYAGASTSCSVMAQSTPNMSVLVSSGTVGAGTSGTVTVTSGNVTVTTADATNPRRDLVVVDAGGTKSVTAGTPAVAPAFPSIPSATTVLASIYVPAGVTAITNAMITDQRVEIPAVSVPALTLGNARQVLRQNFAATALEYAESRAVAVASAIADTTFSNSTADNAVASLSLPLGSVVAGDVLKFRAGGSFLNNSGGAVTYTWKFKIGTTTVATSIAMSYVANASARGWWFDLDIVVESTTAQRVGGQFLATSVIASGMGALTTANCAVIDGSAAENLASAPRNFIASCTMGAANASASVTCREASLVLLRV